MQKTMQAIFKTISGSVQQYQYHSEYGSLKTAVAGRSHQSSDGAQRSNMICQTLQRGEKKLLNIAGNWLRGVAG